MHSRKLKTSDWESVLPDALHAIRSLLCTATNSSPHERLFNYNRRSTSGRSIPSWVKPGRVYVRNHTKRTKNDPPVTSATLVHANPEYAHIRLDSGVETTVNIRDLAPYPVETTEEVDDVFEGPNPLPVVTPDNNDSQVHQNNIEQPESGHSEQPIVDAAVDRDVALLNETLTQQGPISGTPSSPIAEESQTLRRSARKTALPRRYGDYEMN